MVLAHLQELEEQMVELGLKMKSSSPALASVLERSAEALARLTSQSGKWQEYSHIEGELSQLEEELVKTAESAFGEGERQRCLDEAERSLEDYRSRMPNEVYDAAVRSAYLKRMRAHFGIPALSLFYI